MVQDSELVHETLWKREAQGVSQRAKMSYATVHAKKTRYKSGDMIGIQGTYHEVVSMKSVGELGEFLCKDTGELVKGRERVHYAQADEVRLIYGKMMETCEAVDELREVNLELVQYFRRLDSVLVRIERKQKGMLRRFWEWVGFSKC